MTLSLRPRRASMRGVAPAHANRLTGEVEVAPRECEKLAHSQAGERSREEQRSVLLRSRRAHERVDFLRRERIDVRRDPDARALHIGHGISRQTPDAHGPAETAVQYDQP